MKRCRYCTYSPAMTCELPWNMQQETAADDSHDDLSVICMPPQQWVFPPGLQLTCDSMLSRGPQHSFECLNEKKRFNLDLLRNQIWKIEKWNQELVLRVTVEYKLITTCHIIMSATRRRCVSSTPTRRCRLHLQAQTSSVRSCCCCTTDVRPTGETFTRWKYISNNTYYFGLLSFWL